MPTPKRPSTKAKPRIASGQASDLIPPEIRELLGPSPVVDVGEEPVFERLLAGAVSELRPSGMIEWTLVHDFVVTTWEIRQMREYKTSFLKIENVKYSTYEVPLNRTEEEKKDIAEAFRALYTDYDTSKIPSNIRGQVNRKLVYLFEKLAPKETTVENARLENLSVGETTYNRANRFAQVISSQAERLDHLQKMTLMLEKRRDALLRDLDRRQAARRERDAAQRDRNATDVEARAGG